MPFSIPPFAAIVPIITVLLFLLQVGEMASAFECYKNNGLNLEYRSQFCNPVTQPYCLKANVYDGRVVRDCASARDCPQGEGCAPITYDQDGTTDFVCCCMSPLCNAATSTTQLTTMLIFTLPLLLLTLFVSTSAMYRENRLFAPSS